MRPRENVIQQIYKGWKEEGEEPRGSWADERGGAVRQLGAAAEESVVFRQRFQRREQMRDNFYLAL